MGQHPVFFKMTEVPIEVGYRSYIRLLRRKWDIVYHSKDLYFSHANKILEPYYDRTTKEFYGAETNPTRLAIVKFIDQFRDGPGIYEPDNFNDLLKGSKNYDKRNKVRKPYRAGHHQQSHTSLTDAIREKHYQFQDIQPVVRELLPRTHPLKYTLFVEDHPYEKLLGRTWTHVFVPTPVDYEAVDDLEMNSYKRLLIESCLECHDMIAVEPILARYHATLWLRIFWWSKFAVKAGYTFSIMHCCHNPHRWKRNWVNFLITSIAHFGFVGLMLTNPVSKYKLPDRFHDTEALNELKYFKEFVPAIIHKVLVLFKDEKEEIEKPVCVMNTLHMINFLMLGYNYMFGIDHWFSFMKH